MLLMGCAATGYYTTPGNAGYYEQALGGLCEGCSRQFVFSGYQLDNLENISCPYCGRVQNTKMAANRWTYEAQRQQAYANQQALQGLAQGISQAQAESARKRQQIIQDHMRREEEERRTRALEGINRSLDGIRQGY